MFINTLREFKKRIQISVRYRKNIDIILDQTPPPEENLKIRTSWLFDLINWIRREGVAKNELNFTSGAPQAARVRHILQLLDRNVEWKKRTAQTLRSIVKDTRGLELFIEAGLFVQDHFIGEFVARLNTKWIPKVPRERELSYLFSQNFHTQQDFEWIHLLDDHSFSRILELFNFSISEGEENWNSLKSDAEQALLLLTIQLQGLGLSAELRQRSEQTHFENSAFYQLPAMAEEFITEPDTQLRIQKCLALKNKLMDCHQSLNEVSRHLEQNGVSVQIVYKIERLENLLRRIDALLNILNSNPMDTLLLSNFIENLIAENLNKRSLRAFFSQIFALLSRKIVEQNGATGEHYITRTSKEYIELIKSSIGGGLFTSLTAIFKFLIHHLHFESFFSGIFASLNYSLSFLAIHFCHFTLGTKQPSSTAPALAARMHAMDQSEDLEALTEEILNIVRSQFAAILGNIIGVIPMTLLVCWAFHFFFGISVLDADESMKVIKSFSIFGLTAFYAVFTGVLLWLSSLISGWVDNWFTFHQISEALAAHQRVIFIFGTARAKALSLFLRRNIIGIASSVSLGFLLGLAPVIFQFLGLHLEVRHVTLSSGALTAALFFQPVEVFKSYDFWYAIFGILTMGILNVGVAFSLALMLAIKARQIQAPKRKLIYRALLKCLYKNPRLIFWPNKKN